LTASLNILLAEDNPSDVFLIQRALAEHHIPHRLFVATDGEQALKYLGQIGKPGGRPCPDLLLLDIYLPKVDGSGILAEFRKHDQCARTPVIVVASAGTLRDWPTLMALGVDDYFLKPSNLSAFMALGGVVREVVAHRAA
jgi:DNA-binding response OmpR family regulator